MRPSCLLSCLLLTLPLACAGSRAHAARGVPERVVVLASSEVAPPAARSVGAELLGEDEPREVLAREVRSALQARGHRVVAVHVAPPGGPDLQEAQGLAARHGAPATLVVVLTGMDLSALQASGRAEVGMRARLVSAAGEPLWEDARRVPTSVRLYRAYSDWRSHLRQAAIALVGGLP